MTNQSGESVLARWALVPLRTVVGITFLMHGAQKIFVFGIGGTADMLTWVGIPFARSFALVLMVVEVVGGLAIMAGAFARWAGLLLAVEMTVAIFRARMHGGFFTPNGFEFELVLLGACLMFAAMGSGPISVERLWTRTARQ